MPLWLCPSQATLFLMTHHCLPRAGLTLSASSHQALLRRTWQLGWRRICSCSSATLLPPCMLPWPRLATLPLLPLGVPR